VTTHNIDARLYQMEIPLRSPFETAGGTVTTRTVGLVSVTQGSLVGWGEAAPFPGQDEPFNEVLEAARSGGMTFTLAAAIDEAVCDMVARSRNERLVDELGSPRDRVPVSVAVGLGDDAVAIVGEAVDLGIGRVKVKVAPGRIGHVIDIRSRFADLIIGVDANGSFDTSTWTELLVLANLDIAYLEQPFLTLDRPEIPMLSNAGFVVFADESVRAVQDGVANLALPGVAGVVVKPGRLGWQASVALVRVARAAGKMWRSSGLLESGIGRIYSDLLAGASDAFVSDVAPAGWFLTSDFVASRCEGGEIVIPDGVGSGLDIDSEAVAERAVSTVPINGSGVPGLC